MIGWVRDVNIPGSGVERVFAPGSREKHGRDQSRAHHANLVVITSHDPRSVCVLYSSQYHVQRSASTEYTYTRYCTVVTNYCTNITSKPCSHVLYGVL